MASISWKNNASGNWDTAANWSTGTLPGAGDDVTINTSTAATITHSNAVTDTISTLYLGTVDTLAITGGTLDIAGYADLYGAVTQSAGTLKLGNGSFFSDSGYTQTGGTLDVLAGVATIEGTTNSLAGTLTGAGLDFNGGTSTIAAGASVGVGLLELSGGTLSLGETLNYHGSFSASGGTLALGRFTFTTTAAAINGTYVSGAGTLAIGGASTFSNDVIEGSVAVTNSGTIIENGYFYIGYNTGDTVHFTNQAGATLRLAGAATLYGTTGSLLTNAGLLQKTGLGATTIYTSTTSTGTVAVNSGVLIFDGVNNVFGGAISGGGTVDFAAGSDTFQSGLALTVAAVDIAGATVVTGSNFTYAGRVDETSGTLSLNGFSLTLTGSNSFNGGSIAGPGTLTLSGATEISSAIFDLGGTLINTGSITQSGYFYVGYNSTDNNSLQNSVGATYTILSGQTLYGVTGSSVTNAGSFVKSGAGTSGINDSFASTGTLSVGQGVLDLNGATNSLGGTVSGGGTLALQSGTTTIDARAKLTVGHLLLNGATVDLAESLKYAGDLHQTAGVLSLGGHTLTISNASLSGTQSGSGTIASSKSLLIGGGDLLTGSVVLSNTGTATLSSYLYVGYNTGDTAQFVNAAKSVLSMQSGSEIIGVATALVTNAGTILKANGADFVQISDSLTSTGTISVASGGLTLNGPTETISGTITGAAGTINFSSGNASIAAGTTLTVGGLDVSGATLAFAGSTSYAGSFDQSSGIVSLTGDTLTLSGAASFEGGVISGTGTLAATGPVSANTLELTGSTSFTNAGVLTDNGLIYVGTQGSDTVHFTNLSTGTIRLQGSAQIYSPGSGIFSNAGTLIAAGAESFRISAGFSNTGSIAIQQGDVQIGGPTTTLGGTITGGGTLELSGGNVALSPATITVSNLLLDGAAASLSANLSYAGLYTQTGGSFTVTGHKLTLSSSANALQGGDVTGSGTLALTGTSEIGNFQFDGALVATNTGAMTIENGGLLYVGANSGDTASFANEAGATITMLGGAEIYTAAAGTFSNAGSLVAEGTGNKTMAIGVINTGTIDVAQGGMLFQGTVGGAGSFVQGAGTGLVFQAATSGGAVTMGLDSTLGVNVNAGFTDVIGGFAAGNLIDLNGFGYSGPPTLAFNAGTDKLTVTEGSSSFTLAFSGPHTAADFLAVNDHGTIGIVHS